MTVPIIKAFLWPVFFIIKEAGIIMIAAPIVVMATGSVARFLSGAICIPMIPDNVITSMETV